MTNPRNPSIDEAAKRTDERQRVREELEGRLARGGVGLNGSESNEQLVDLSNALEAFDLARARAGGDSMVNTPESSQPDDRRLVLPLRRDDESVERYLVRLRGATEMILATVRRV